MAQASLPQIMNTPQDLVAAGNVAPQYLWALDQYMKNAQQANQMGLADMQRQTQQNRAMDPLTLEKMRLENEGQGFQNANTQAGLPGIIASGRQTQLQNELKEALLPQEKIAGFKKLVAEGDENDRKHAEEQVWKMIQSQDPKQRAIGMQLRGTMKDAIQEAEKSKAEMAKVAAQNKNAKEIMQMQIDAGRFDKANKFASNFAEHFSSLKTAAQKHAALIFAAKQAQQEGNLEMAQKYTELAETVRPQAEAELAMLPKPGSVDVNKTTEGRVPTVPQGSIAPPGAKAPPGSSADNPIILK